MKPNLQFQFSSEDRTRLTGLPIFEKARPERFAAGGSMVRFHHGREHLGFSLVREKDGYLVRYAFPCDAYRALGLLLADDPPENLSQNRAHESVGVMWDLSRNAVLRVEAWEELLRKFALLGINSVQLYMEDVYELPGEPFFGYGRGAYSTDELRRIDEYGYRLGIEVIPCIQTLGHLDQILQWPVYQADTDVPGVLMVGEERTRHLIGKMLQQMAACFRSRKIHIGMDEAHGIGTGKYLEKNGLRRPFDILLSHLRMVVGMCRECGLRPMIWSDMFFRIGSATHGYYDREAVIPEGVAAEILSDVDLVYWDYYHADPAFYEEWIRRHRMLGKEPVFAAGAWNWGRFWAYAPRWRESMAAGMKAAREQKIGQTLLTLWGDNGAEYHPASALPAIQYFAEWAYAGEPDAAALERQFVVLAKAPLRDYLKASDLDEIPAVRGTPEATVNYSKWILWHDPVLGFLNAHIPSGLPDHYRGLAADLDRTDADESLRFAIRVARAVAAKAELHLKARAAWRASDWSELRRLKEMILPESQQTLRELWQSHRRIWNEWNKPFGWEVLERRYAGTAARLESLGAILDKCLSEPGVRIPEWEFEPLPLHGSELAGYFNYDQTTTPSASK